jgi:hypothetical protein
MKNETKQLNETKNVSSGRLDVGREYLIRAPGVLVLGTYTGMADVGDGDRARELPRFWPVTWLRGGEDVIDPCWPIYAGPRATLRPVAAFGTATGHR